MNISSIRLQNFCCFADRRFDLAPRFNLLVGENGSGKTSILDGLAVGLGAWFLGLTGSNVTRNIHRDEARFVPLLQGETYTRERQFPVVVHCRGSVAGEAGEWSRELNNLDGRTTRQHATWIEGKSAELDSRVRAGAAVTLPVISYYGTGRLWLQKRQKAIDPLPPGSRFLGYLDCLDPASDEKRLLAWFKTMEIQAIQEGKPIAVLEAVRQSILACVEGASRVGFSVAQDELLLRFDDREVPFGHLSDGYRNLLAMVADIAVRCATLNPAAREEAIRSSPGVVLIDEIDLHLHPKWQRRVVGDLLKAFPRIQFVATTHSPFVIQSLPPREGVRLLNLDNSDADSFANLSIEDVAEGVQGVSMPSRSQRYQDMMRAAEEYYRALDRADEIPADQFQHLKDQLDELASRFSDDPAYHAMLKVEREARLGKEDDDAPG